jgi:uncharacterized protein (TIGR02145 family)
MKKITLLFIAIITVVSYSLTAQVAITTDGSSADGSAMLDVQSTERGFLPPRMTTTERDAIISPAEGLTIYNNDNNCLEFFNGSFWISMCSGTLADLKPGDVFNPITGKIWMDRNLGANQVATSSTDPAGYGYLYQWGRAADGHEIVYRTTGDGPTSVTTSINATTTVPGTGENAWDGKFITESNSPYDWLTTQNVNLWQGVNGVNNPCPTGYRLPTEEEWNAERLSWSSNDATGAFASSLKLPVPGGRSYSSGDMQQAGVAGVYWSSTVNSLRSTALNFGSSYAIHDTSSSRGFAYSVRCIKD